VVNASAGGADEDAYYRTYRDEPHPFPAVVERNGTHYFVRSTVVVDDIDTDGRFLGLLGSGLGLYPSSPAGWRRCSSAGTGE
jgi:hypothetical protein